MGKHREMKSEPWSNFILYDYPTLFKVVRRKRKDFVQLTPISAESSLKMLCVGERLRHDLVL